MLAKRLRCHEGHSASRADCNDRGGARLASCTHSSDAASSVAWLAISPPVSDVQSLSSSPELFVTAHCLPLGELPEPPTDPPRFRFVA
jgi:hypothetical protein